MIGYTDHIWDGRALPDKVSHDLLQDDSDCRASWVIITETPGTSQCLNYLLLFLCSFAYLHKVTRVLKEPGSLLL